jgi:hypothetical protein
VPCLRMDIVTRAVRATQSSRGRFASTQLMQATGTCRAGS